VDEGIFSDLERFAAEEMTCALDILKRNSEATSGPAADIEKARCVHCKFLARLAEVKAEYEKRGEPFPSARPKSQW
jgi:hypothetical protein